MSNKPSAVRIGEAGATSLGRAAAILIVAASTAAAGQPARGAGSEPIDLSAVPAPPLADFDEGVAERLRSRRTAVADLLTRRPFDDETVEALGELCLLYLAYDLSDSAAPCLEQLRRLRPTDFRWAYYLGLLHLRDAALEPARSNLEAALALRPDDLPALLRAGELYLLEQEPEQAEAVFRAALELEPESSAARFGLGRIAAGGGDPAAAISHFEAALAGQPEGSLVHYHLGLAHRELGHLERARVELERNRQRPVAFADPLAQRLDALASGRESAFFRGVEARRQGRPREAIAIFRRLLEEGPEEAEIHHNLARALLEISENGELEAAETHLRRALELAPGFFDAHVNLAILLGRQGRVEEAAQHLERAVEIDPDNLPTRVLWARLLAGRGEEERALAELEAVLSLDPATPGARLALGALLAERGEHAAAERTLVRALEERAAGEHELAEGHLRLALLHRRAGRPGEVLQHLQTAVELDPRSAEVRSLLAEELASAGRFADAAAELATVIELAPGNRSAHRGRGLALILAADYPAARRALETSLRALPDDAVIADLLARLLATCPDPAVRDGRRAVALAEAVVEAETTLDHAETLAMALAEAGRFEDAVLVQRRVLEEEQTAAGTVSARRRQRLALYEERRPVRAPWLGPEERER